MLFGDPVFLLTWQVHLVTFGLLSLMAVWCALGKQSWYVGTTVSCGLLWLFIPLNAPEPVIAMLVFMPLLMVGAWAVDRWFVPGAPRTERGSATQLGGWRFGLSDLLWFVLLVGMVTGLIVQCWKMPWYFGWTDQAISGACFLSVILLTIVAQGQGGKLCRTLGVVIAVALAIAAGVHYLLVKQDFLSMSWAGVTSDFLTQFVGLLFGQKEPPRPDVFLVFLCSFLEIFTFTALALPSIRTGTKDSNLPSAPKRRVLSIVGATCTLLLISGLAVVYIAILLRPTWPTEDWPERNDRDALLKITRQFAEAYPPAQTWRDVDAPGGKSYSRELVKLFDESEVLLKNGTFTMFDSRHDTPDANKLIDATQNLRKFARALGAQSKADWLAGRRRDSLRRDTTNMRLGNALQQHAIAVQTLVGIALEGIGSYHLAEVRDDLTPDEIGEIDAFLAELESSRADPELMLARDQLFDEYSLGWRQQTRNAIRRLVGRGEHESREAMLAALRRQDAFINLLRTDLAIRRFKHTRGRWPQSLEELVPGQLPKLLEDPLGRHAFVYRPTETGFQLYSVGIDGVDNGGQLSHPHDRGKDFDLDYAKRME